MQPALDDLTGADISAVVSGAFTRAQRAKIDSLREVILGEMKQEGGMGAFEENCHDEEDGNDSDRTVAEMAARINKLPTERLRILVTKHHLLEAARALTPSVSGEELKHYEKLAQQYNDL